VADDVLYQPRYCEENAWHLSAAPHLAGADPHVIVVSNAGRRVAMWMQRAAAEHEAITWDYHALVVAHTDGWQAWDPDTRLGMPVALTAYTEISFATVGVQPPRFDPLFRIMTAASYRASLRSDRSHMRRADCTWLAPPPPWPTLSDPTEGSNLQRFVDMTDTAFGSVVDLAGLRERFC